MQEILTKLIKRYIARILTEIEESPPNEHKKIIKKQLWYLKDDLIGVCDDKK